MRVVVVVEHQVVVGKKNIAPKSGAVEPGSSSGYTRPRTLPFLGVGKPLLKPEQQEQVLAYLADSASSSFASSRETGKSKSSASLVDVHGQGQVASLSSSAKTTTEKNAAGDTTGYSMELFTHTVPGLESEAVNSPCPLQVESDMECTDAQPQPDYYAGPLTQTTTLPSQGADQESDPDETMLPHHERYTTDRQGDTVEVAHELQEEVIDDPVLDPDWQPLGEQGAGRSSSEAEEEGPQQASTSQQVPSAGPVSCPKRVAKSKPVGGQRGHPVKAQSAMPEKQFYTVSPSPLNRYHINNTKPQLFLSVHFFCKMFRNRWRCNPQCVTAQLRTGAVWVSAEMCCDMRSRRLRTPRISRTCSDCNQTFISAVNRDIEMLKNNCQKNFKHPNMTADEIEALQLLAKDDEIIIKKADKGGAVVVLDKNEYIEEIKGQLADPGVYERLSHDPKFDIAKAIKLILNEALDLKVIDQDTYDFLNIKFPITPVLYTLPKIHKSLIHPPGRPIVSGCGSILSNIGILLDKILNPLACQMKSYVRDTSDFLDKINTIQLAGQVLLASFDVTSLYTSIDHDRGLNAIDKKLSTTQYSVEARKFILQLLKLVLTNNYFLFGDDFYLQRRGVAMGANMAPAYANIVMGVLEEDFVYVSHHFGNVSAWWRYIDDVFLIWTGSESSLTEFHNFLNIVDDTIKFTLVYSNTNIQFLDVNVKIEDVPIL
ncbi:unnamed protein product [Ranitomeya imitator]|uniref:Reverse transcriptase domain-containing protein n=1 Tax=Ranitomeya imitator TaxID=111125 RepID=A0ABN9LTM3_9NEOB|nr:unnamed protein product [Ranitomeya imitator]